MASRSAGRHAGIGRGSTARGGPASPTRRSRRRGRRRAAAIVPSPPTTSSPCRSSARAAVPERSTSVPAGTSPSWASATSSRRGGRRPCCVGEHPGGAAVLGADRRGLGAVIAAVDAASTEEIAAGVGMARAQFAPDLREGRDRTRDRGGAGRTCGRDRPVRPRRAALRRRSPPAGAGGARALRSPSRGRPAGPAARVVRPVSGRRRCGRTAGTPRSGR
jgi:hypothetical protein